MILQYAHRTGILWLCLLLIYAAPAPKKPKPGLEAEKAEPLLLRMQIEGRLSVDMDGYLYEDALFLPVIHMLSSLKLPYTYHRDRYRIEVNAPEFGGDIKLDFSHKKVDGAVYDVHLTDEDFLIADGEIYVRMLPLERIFGFKLSFDYRRLLVELSSQKPLPVLQYHQRRQSYGALRSGFMEAEPEIVFPAGHHLLNGWFADWSVNSTHSMISQNYSYGLSLGGHLLGGGLTLHAGGSKTYGFGWEQIRGQWKLPFYNSRAVEQFVVGDQGGQNVLGGTYLSYRGVSLSNTPKAPRRIFTGSYGISYPVEEGWDAELYVNNRLSAVVTASGNDTLRSTFPLRYGTNSLGLRYFSPDGISYEQNYQIDILRDFLPAGEIEYDLSAGYYRTYNDEPFAKAEVNWGLSDHVTVGGGMHVIPGHTLHDSDPVPFMQAWTRLGYSLILEGTHTHQYYSRAALQYTFPNLRRLYLSYKKYHKTTMYNRLGKLSEASANTSVPLLQRPHLTVSAYASARYTRYHLHHSMYVYGGISSSLPLGIQLRMNSRVDLRSAELVSMRPVQHSTDVTISKRLLRRILFRPGFRYDHVQNRIVHSQLGFNTRVFGNGYLSVITRRNHMLGQNSVLFRFTLNLPFARHSSYADITQSLPAFRQHTSGTIAFDSWNKIHTDYMGWVDDAAARIDPFLDLNNNARKDPGEPRIEGVEASYYTAGGLSAPVRRGRDVARQLTPYETYLVQINAASIDNPLWVPKYKYYQVQVSPNMVNKIPVPIMASGEISGSVQMAGEDRQAAGLNGLALHLSNSLDTVRDTLFTYGDGAFFQIGLKPGEYTLALDRKQLKERSLTAVKDSVGFTVVPTMEGDIIDGLQLVVTPGSSVRPARPLLDKVYTIQIGAFKNRLNAARLITMTRQLTGAIKSRIVYDPQDGFYRCHIGLFDDEQTAWAYITQLRILRPEIYDIAYIVELDIDQASDF